MWCFTLSIMLLVRDKNNRQKLLFVQNGTSHVLAAHTRCTFVFLGKRRPNKTVCTHNNIKLLQPNIILLPRRLHKTQRPYIIIWQTKPQMSCHHILTYPHTHTHTFSCTHIYLTCTVFVSVCCWEPSHYAQTDWKNHQALQLSFYQRLYMEFLGISPQVLIIFFIVWKLIKNHVHL